MGFKDPEKQREYQRMWIARRKAEFFADKSCAVCGSTENLELDHIDRTQKVSHNIWSWSEVRRNAELAKCQVLCHDCHLIKSKESGDLSHGRSGESHWNSRLSDEDIREIRRLVLEGMTHAAVAVSFSVSRPVITDIINGKMWAHVV